MDRDVGAGGSHLVDIHVRDSIDDLQYCELVCSIFAWLNGHREVKCVLDGSAIGSRCVPLVLSGISGELSIGL